MYDLNELIQDILSHHRSIDIAESEFRRMMADDDDLRVAYKDWCEECGYTEKHGFREYCEEYLDSQDSIWETLNDYDD